MAEQLTGHIFGNTKNVHQIFDIIIKKNRLISSSRCPNFSSLIKIRVIQHLQVVHDVNIKKAESIISNNDISPGQVEQVKPTPPRVIPKPVKNDDKPEQTFISKGSDNSPSVQECLLVDDKNKARPDSQMNDNKKSEADVSTEMIPKEKLDTLPKSVLNNSALADVSLSSSIVGVIQDLETPKIKVIKRRPRPSRKTGNKVSINTSNTTDPGAPSKDKGKFECNSCLFSGDTRLEMLTHAKEQHLKLSPATKSESLVPIVSAAILTSKCLLCDYETAKLEDMSNHMVEDGHFAVTCPHCSYMPTSSEDLMEHGKSH